MLILKLEIWNKDGLLSKKQIQMDGIKNSLKVSKSKLNKRKHGACGSTKYTSE